MIRQRISSRQRNLFVCAFCRTACRPNQRPLQHPSLPRWYSSAGQPQLQHGINRNTAVSRSGPTRAPTARVNTRAFEEDDDDDDLLPHELAARARETAPPPPPPPPASEPEPAPSEIPSQTHPAAENQDASVIPPPNQVPEPSKSKPLDQPRKPFVPPRRKNFKVDEDDDLLDDLLPHEKAAQKHVTIQEDKQKRLLLEENDDDFLTPEEVTARARSYRTPKPPGQASPGFTIRRIGYGAPGGHNNVPPPPLRGVAGPGKSSTPTGSSTTDNASGESSRPPWAQLSRRPFQEPSSAYMRPEPTHSLEDVSDVSQNVWAPSVNMSRKSLPSPLSRSMPRVRKDIGRGPSSSLRRDQEGQVGASAFTKTPPENKISAQPTQKANGSLSQDAGDGDFFAQFEGLNDKKARSKTPTKTQRGDEQEWNWIKDVEKKAEINAQREEVLEKLQDIPKSTEPMATSDAAPAQNPQYREVADNRRSRGRDREVRDFSEKSKPKPRFSKNNYRDDDESFSEEAEAMAQARRKRKEQRRLQREMEELEKQEAAATKSILVPEYITVADLGQSLGYKPAPFLSQLLKMGFEDITVESVMAGETAALVAQEYGFEPILDVGEQVDLKPRPPPADPSALAPRPPIVTIMGHVDHGKTTMLDYLRKSSVAAGEHGGITQHIGAFSVKMSTGKVITFLDTPGHAAFLTMRQRGANITDMVILVVAADDSVKPQTLEALKHARGAKVPIIVAINKVDKDEARVDQVKLDLANNGVQLEDFGGDVQAVCVSGKTGLGMADLEENIIALAEMLDMRAETDGMAEGWILESAIKPLGRAASILVKRGTLRKGDLIVAGTSFAKVRLMLNEAGQEVDEAPPGTPVEVFGWRGTPSAGDMVLQAPDEDRAREATRYREEMAAWQKTAEGVAAQEKAEREKAERERVEAEMKELMGEDGEAGVEEAPPGTTMVNFIIKGDVMGSVEAVYGAVMEIGNNEVRPRVLRSAPGQVTESDVEHAATTGSHIISFNNPIQGHIERMADQKGVRIMDHSIIYHLVDEVKAVLSEKLPPSISFKVNGEAEVLQVFPINIKGRKYKNIAGCRVRNGLIVRNSMYRVIRGTEEVFNGKLESLKHVKKDISEAKKNSECGIQFDGWDEIQVGDKIQAYEEVKETRYLP
ncbi:hypothetical protein MCOR14_003954 [Pyricularia oryzae]|nr:hypothetical protein MCOR14_003954 [Pyricularia oryzae]